jgi:PAS domain-containing protein
MSTETEITKPLRGGWSQQLGILLESTGEGIYGIDLKGRCIFINSAGPEIVGYTPDKVLERNMHYLIHHSRTDSGFIPVHDCRIFIPNFS